MGKADPLYDRIPDHRHRFVDLVGEVFVAGAACGSATYFVSGARSSPGRRLAGGVQAVRSNAPRLAGLFASCAALYGALRTAMALARQKDDAWNCLAAGAASTALVSLRFGGRAAAWNTLLGAACDLVIDGADWVAGEWDVRFASQPPTTTTTTTTTTTNPRLLAPAVTTNPNSTDPRGSTGTLSLLRSSTPSQSSTSEKDLQVLDLSRKLLLEKMRKGFHLPAPEYRFSAVSPWWESSFCWRRM